MAVHFDTSGHSVDNTIIRVIQKLWKDDPVLGKNRESRWIYTFSTANLGGLNPRIDSL